MKKFLHPCIENRISWIFGLFFENAHEWKMHHWNPQQPRTRCIRNNPLDISDGHGFYKSWHAKVKIGLDCCTWSFHITFLSSCFIVEKKCTRSATIFQLMAVSLGQSNFRIISWFCQLHAMQSKSISEPKRSQIHHFLFSFSNKRF